MPYGKGALAKGLEVLHLLGSGQPLTVQRIAERLAIPTSSAYRLVHALRAYAIVEPVHSSGSELRLGMVIFDWAERLKGSIDLVRLARPFLEQLAAEAHETAQLTLARGDEAVTVDIVEYPAPVRVAPTIGRALPLYCGAASTAILAFLLEAQWPKDKLERIGPQAFSSVSKLHADLKTARELGYALSTEEVYEGAAACAVPLFDLQQRPIASLALSGPIHRFNLERMGHGLTVLKTIATNLQDTGYVVAGPSPVEPTHANGGTS